MEDEELDKIIDSPIEDSCEEEVWMECECGWRGLEEDCTVTDDSVLCGGCGKPLL
jgi:hypothetical protein